MEKFEETVPKPKQEKKASICRVCLNDEPCHHKGLSLFEKYNDMFIFEKINYISSIEIKQGDGLPERICSNCLLALESASNFKQQCESSDAILRSALERGKPLEKYVEISIKQEDEYTYDYLEKNMLSPAQSQSSAELQPCLDVKLNIEDYKTVPFKSKAIDLHLECNDCGSYFKSKCKLRVHWKKVHLPEQLICKICKKACKSYKAFHNHMKYRTKNCLFASKMRIEGIGRSRVYHCLECDASSNRFNTLKTHLVTHTGERPYSCNMCNKTFTQHSSMTAHKEGTHKTYFKEGQCHLCGKYFKGRLKLYRHMKTHSVTQFPCKVCDKVLKSKGSWRQHMRRHSDKKPFTCEMCAKSFYTTSDLCNHRSKVHEKRKVYTCDLCEYKTVNPTCIKRHRPRHTDNNVACDICGTFVQNRQQLELHKKRHFEKNYQCSFCDKLYYGRKNLSAHVRSKHNVYTVAGRTISVKSKVEVELDVDAKPV